MLSSLIEYKIFFITGRIKSNNEQGGPEVAGSRRPCQQEEEGNVG